MDDLAEFVIGSCKFYIPYKFLSSFEKKTTDLSMLDLSAIINNKKYLLSESSVNYDALNQYALSSLENDLTHLAKLYSQFSYTLRQKVTPIINNYEYKRFNSTRKNIEDAIRFLALLSRIRDFSSLNKRILNIYKKKNMIHNKDDKEIEEIIKCACEEKQISLETIPEAVDFVFEEIKDYYKELTECGLPIAINNAIERYLVDSAIESALDPALATDKFTNSPKRKYSQSKVDIDKILAASSAEDLDETNTNFIKSFKKKENSSYFYSEDAILNIARTNNLTITKSAARKVAEILNANKSNITTLSDYENAVIDCITSHATKIYQAKLNTTLKMNLSKAGFSLSEISQEMLENFYDYIIQNINTIPQDFFDRLARNFYKMKTNTQSQIIDSSARFSFNDVVNKIPSIKEESEVFTNDEDTFIKKSPISFTVKGSESYYTARDKCILEVLKIHNVHLDKSDTIDFVNWASEVKVTGAENRLKDIKQLLIKNKVDINDIVDILIKIKEI